MQQYELNVGDIKEVKRKVTQVESSKRYYENNKEKVAARQKLYKKKNKKKEAAKAKCYYENNKEKVMAQTI